MDQDNLSGLARTSTNEELSRESHEQASFPTDQDRQSMTYYTTYHSVLCIANIIGLNHSDEPCCLISTSVSLNISKPTLAIDWLPLAFISGLEFLVKKKIENLAE